MNEFRNPGCTPAHEYVPDDEIRRIRKRWYDEYEGHGDCVTITAAEHLITDTIRESVAKGMTCEQVGTFVQEFAASVFSTLFPKGMEMTDGRHIPLKDMKIVIVRLGDDGEPEFFKPEIMH